MPEGNIPAWTIRTEADVEKRLKKLRRKFRAELRNVFDNLDTYFKCLQAGANPGQIHRGFIHNEPKGVIAIDEKGKGAHLKALRMYLYPDAPNEVLYVITIGDKASQKSDIRFCSSFVDGLRAKNEFEGLEISDDSDTPPGGGHD